MLKGRRLAVTMADSRPGRAALVSPFHLHPLSYSSLLSNPAGAREETNGRSIRVKGVPDGTQEAILQQALEKIVPVIRVQLLAERNEAIVELTNMAVR